MQDLLAGQIHMIFDNIPGALATLGAPAQQVVYPGARHAFDFDSARSDSKDAQARAIEFLQRHLK